MPKAVELKLQVSLIPECLHGFNLHAFIPKSRWSKVRMQIIAERGLRCEICGIEVEKPADLDAHHEWEYDEASEPPVVTLSAIGLSCKYCHRCEHFGNLQRLVLTGIMPESVIADHIAHYCKVNGVTEKTFDKQRRQAILEKERRAKLHWRADWGQFASILLEYMDELPQPGPPIKIGGLRGRPRET